MQSLRNVDSSSVSKSTGRDLALRSLDMTLNVSAQSHVSFNTSKDGNDHVPQEKQQPEHKPEEAQAQVKVPEEKDREGYEQEKEEDGQGQEEEQEQDHKQEQEQKLEQEKEVSQSHPFNFCTKRSFPIPLPDDPGRETYKFGIEYWCNGTEYEQFGELFQDFLVNQNSNTSNGKVFPQTQQRSTQWGRYAVPLPAGRSVLCMGNSHTKQTVHELICQFSHQTKAFRRYHNKIYSVEFDNNSSLTLVYNSPIEAALNWTAKLESMIHRPLESFDAILLGQFNSASRDIQNTTFYREMMNLSRQDADVDFGKVEPPDLLRVAQAFSDRGPIVFASNYDKGKFVRAQQIADAMDQHPKAHTMRHVVARHYIPHLNHNECGTDDREGVGTCRASARGAHRCVGPNGGYPTLAAYDVQDHLFSLLSPPQ